MGARQEASETLGERFERERDRLGLTRSELALSCGYSAEQVRRVERDLQKPGSDLLAALVLAGGDAAYVLIGGSPSYGMRSREEGIQVPSIDELLQAEYRLRVKQEAREHGRMKSDRLKKVLSESEADLLERFRGLSSDQQRRAIAAIELLAAGGSLGGSVVASGHGKAAGRDINEAGPPPKRGR